MDSLPLDSLPMDSLPTNNMPTGHHAYWTQCLRTFYLHDIWKTCKSSHFHFYTISLISPIIQNAFTDFPVSDAGALPKKETLAPKVQSKLSAPDGDVREIVTASNCFCFTARRKCKCKCTCL